MRINVTYPDIAPPPPIDETATYVLTLTGAELTHIVMLSYLEEGGSRFPWGEYRVAPQIAAALNHNPQYLNDWCEALANAGWKHPKAVR